MEQLVEYATISPWPCKIETLDKSVELPLEDSSHSVTSDIKLEDFVVKTEHLSENCSPFDTAKRIKLEIEDIVGDERPFESHSHSDVSGKFDDQMKTEIISPGPSQVPTFIQELVYIDRDDQRCKMDCEVSIHSGGSGSHDMAAAATVEDGQADLPTDSHFENSDEGVHEDILPSAQDISNHSCNPHEKKLYKCSERDKEYTTTTTMLNLQKHVRTQSGKKSYKCPTCQKTFSKKGTLDFHITTHTGEEAYGSLTCGKTFSRKFLLDGHIKTHTGEKPYSCFECGSAFSQKSNLLRHIKTHTGEKPYECCTCGRTFSTNYVLKRHIKVHTGEKPHCCLTCGKTFPRKSTLDIHIRNHTGETPYACTDCGKEYKTSSSLFYHMKTHAAEKMYACGMCGRRFNQKCTLTCHLRIHSREKKKKK